MVRENENSRKKDESREKKAKSKAKDYVGIPDMRNVFKKKLEIIS